MFDKPKTQSMAKFLVKEAARVTGLSIESPEHDGDKASVWIYTDSTKWCDSSGAGSFRGSSESDAIKRFYREVRKAD